LTTELMYSPKIRPEHLARRAIVYLRQSSEKQVRQNLESQRLQYEVAERIRVLGWTQVEIIDSDLGSSASMASARREGFERVLSAVREQTEELRKPGEASAFLREVAEHKRKLSHHRAHKPHVHEITAEDIEQIASQKSEFEVE